MYVINNPVTGVFFTTFSMWEADFWAKLGYVIEDFYFVLGQ